LGGISLIVKTPVPEWSGYVRGVYFSRGVAECDDKVALEWFQSRGYTVEDSDVVEDEVEEIPTEESVTPKKTRKSEDLILITPTNYHEPLPNLSKFSVEELREFMMQSGISPGRTMSRSRLLQKIYDTWG
jgi:hypothetical protein